MKMIVDVNEMREKIIQEMGCRRLSDSSGHFAEKGQGKETLLSITGAVNIYAALGINLGNFHQRKEWAKRILRYQKANGEFGSGEGNEHSTAMAIAALNILGALPEKPIRVSAPVEVKNLPSWLNNRDWSSTLKDLWGGVTPLLASGLCSSEWI
ncbi:MAG: hypothetical protein KAX20_06615, partial [Candidatus Omnitrophica bacterium]|nr:hypothetical protein [Candidatus Omnitrophota bacterium]